MMIYLIIGEIILFIAVMQKADHIWHEARSWGPLKQICSMTSASIVFVATWPIIVLALFFYAGRHGHRS